MKSDNFSDLFTVSSILSIDSSFPSSNPKSQYLSVKLTGHVTPCPRQELNNTSVRRVEAVCNSVGHFASLVTSTGSTFSTTSSTLLAAQSAAQSGTFLLQSPAGVRITWLLSANCEPLFFTWGVFDQSGKCWKWGRDTFSFPDSWPDIQQTWVTFRTWADRS
jgi:hypothetical protein